jgi:large subunit ribosomal protein L22
LVANLVRGERAIDAQNILANTHKRTAQPLSKLLQSAIATAKNDFSYQEDNLKISQIFVNEGPTLKRWRPRAYGRAYPIMKRTSHITIELEEIEKGKGHPKKKSKDKSKNLEVKKAKDIESEKISKAKDIKAKKESISDENIKDRGSQKGLLKKVFRRKSG